MNKHVLGLCSITILAFGLVGSPVFAKQQTATPPGAHLNITNVEVQEPNTIMILGEDFDFGEPLQVTLGGVNGNGIGDITTDCMLQSPNMITCTLPADLPPAGDYLLTVSTGNGQSKGDEYDLTIGAVGPQGDPGDQGVQGKLGDTGAQGVQGKLGDTGAQGVQGMIGPQGDPGFGFPGPPGLSCAEQFGFEACRGKPGRPGEQGVQGKMGEPGEDGADVAVCPCEPAYAATLAQLYNQGQNILFCGAQAGGTEFALSMGDPTPDVAFRDFHASINRGACGVRVRDDSNKPRPSEVRIAVTPGEMAACQALVEVMVSACP